MRAADPDSWLSRVGGPLVRHKGKVVLFFLTVMGGVALATWLTPRAYRSQGKLLVRLGRENVTLDPTATFGQAPVVAVPASRENELNSVLEILTSQVLLEKVLDSVGPRAILGRAEPAPPNAPPSEVDPEERYQALLTLGKRLSVDAVKKSNVIVLTYTGPSPEVSRAVVARLMDFYLEQHIHLHRTAGAHKFLAEQTDRLRAYLNRAEEAVRDLKSETGLIAPDRQRQALVGRVAHLEDELLQAATATAAVTAEVEALKKQLADTPRTEVISRTKGMPNQAADQMRAQLFALQVKQRELELRHPETHPEVKQARQLTETARTLLTQEEKDREQVVHGTSKVYEEAQLSLARQQHQLAALEARTATLRQQLEQARSEVKVFNQNELRLTRLEREADLQNSQYRKYAENLEQARIDGALEQERIASINVVQPATRETHPVSPRLLFNLGLGLAAAVCGAFALVYLAEQRGSTTRTPPESEPRQDLPGLVAAPHLDPQALAQNGTGGS